MTVLALFAMAAAPNLRQQAQREREKEAIFRGEQVADAIRDYYLYKAGIGGGAGEQALPTSMDQLLEGIPIPGGSKKRQMLRASAARDPLSTDGEWRTVRPRTEALIDFQRAVMFYAGSILPPPTQRTNRAITTVCSSAINKCTRHRLAGTAPGGERHMPTDASGPFVGVASRSRSEIRCLYLLRH